MRCTRLARPGTKFALPEQQRPLNKPVNKTDVVAKSSAMATSPDKSLLAETPKRFNIAEFFLDAPALRHPHKTAIFSEPARVTYAELSALGTRLGHSLLEPGIPTAAR